MEQFRDYFFALLSDEEELPLKVRGGCVEVEIGFSSGLGFPIERH